MADSAPNDARLRVHRDDPEYQRLAGLEAAFWDRPGPYSLEQIERIYEDGPFERYLNARYTGDPTRPWWHTIAGAGRFRRGIVLGTSAMTLEHQILASNPGLHLTFVDISPGALARREEELGRTHRGRVATLKADLNFLDLPHHEYDLVVSAASLHHVTNLEYLAEQISGTLRPGGRFFLQDYVGEPRFQFSTAKKRAFEALHDAYLRRVTPSRAPGLTFQDASDLSPFCGVRSDDTLGVLAARLDTVSVRTSGALTIPLGRALPVDTTRIGPPPLRRRLATWLDDTQRRMRGRRPQLRSVLSADFLAELFAADAMLCDSGLLLPGTAFAVYAPC